MAGQSTRHGQMCARGFSVEGGNRSGHKTDCACARVCSSLWVFLFFFFEGEWMDQLLCCATDTSLFFYLQSGLWLKLPLVSLCSRVCELAIEGETHRERDSLPAAATVSDY